MASFFCHIIGVVLILFYFNNAQPQISCEIGYIEPKTQIKRTNLTSCFFPSSESELQEFILSIINENDDKSTTIRPIGSSISVSANGMLDEFNFETKDKYANVIAVNMSSMNRILSLNLTSNTITFEAGLKVIDILEYLESYNASLKYVDGPTLANIVGWFITGTAGESGYKSLSNISTLSTGVMANNVVGLRMIIGNGSIIELDNKHNNHLLNAALISFGSLGIITQVTMSVVPILPYFTKQSAVIIPNISNTMIINDSIYNNIIPAMGNDSTVQWLLNLFDEQITYSLDTYEGNNMNMNLTNDTFRCWINENNVTIRYKYTPCTDIYYKVKMPPATTGIGARNLQTEFYVTDEHGVDAFLEVLSFFFDQKKSQTKLWNDTYELYRIENDWTINFQFKWVDGDDSNHNIWLSPGFNQTSMIMININFHQLTPEYIYYEWINSIYQLLNENFLHLTPIRVNFAKISLSEYCYLRDSYPKLEEFKKLREEFDPYNLFLNSFTRDKLGICDNKCCCTEYSCSYDRDEEEDDNTLEMILIYSAIGLLALVCIVISIWYVVKKRKQRNIAQNEMSTLLT